MIQASPYRSEFNPPTEESVCLNHAGISPIPKRTMQKISQFVETMGQGGSINHRRLETAQEVARIQCAGLIGAEVDRVAFTRNTSEGLSYVALGMEWSSGDEIITTDQEFPSNLVIWLDTARRHGVVVHQVASMYRYHSIASFTFQGGY